MSAINRATNPGTLLAADVLEVLRLVAVHGGQVSMRLLRAHDPNPSTRRGTTTTRVNQLRGSRLVKAYKPNPRLSTVVEITPAGRQALAAAGADVKPATSTPAPAVVDLERARATRAARHGSTWSATPASSQAPEWAVQYAEACLRSCVRPGALRAFSLPSLVNGERVERTRPPIIMASTRPDRLQDGRGRS